MIKKDIVPWIKKRPYWQQYISEKILSGAKLDEADLDYIYDILKKEFELVDEPLDKEVLKLCFFNSSDAIEPIKWRGLKNVCGVNALKNDEELKIGDNLTLIYGKNGSGKSGYTRLLNNIFISRGDKNILPNVFNNKKENINADIIFEDSNDELIIHNFSKVKKHSHFDRVSVFDSQSVIHDLSKESELSFLPSEFIFFEKLLEYTLEIKNRLDNEIHKKTSENHFIKYFENDTSIKKLIYGLNPNTNIKELIIKLEITELDTEKYKKLTDRKLYLYSLKIDKKNETYESYISDIKDIKTKNSILKETFNIIKLEEIKDLIENKNMFEEMSKKDGLEQFKDYEIDELGSNEWKTFIKAAHDYSKIINKENNHCIFCLQSIDDMALIDKYYNYLKSNIEKKIEKSDSEVKEIKSILENLSHELIIKKSKIDEWLEMNQKHLYHKILNSEQKYNQLIIKTIYNLKHNIWENDIGEYLNKEFINEDELDNCIDLIKEKQKNLNLEKISEELEEIKSFEDEYADKQKIKTLDLISELKTFIENMSWVAKAKNHLISTRTITKFQNRLFSKYVNPDYIKKFDEECETLNAKFSAKIEKRGKEGTTLKRLTVEGKKPITILSEGEQRVIALANFLAETNLHNKNICIIFDDPVSSLDYLRREDIASRLIKEAKNKQVVIFTHDLTFLLSLLQKSEDKKIDCLITQMSKIQNTTGIIENNLPWIGMPVKKRIGHLKNELQQLKKLERNITPETPAEKYKYENSAKLWCENLRETWERSIEEILLNDAVQRFNPAIQTQRLKKATFTNELYEDVENGMSDCSQWVHDRAAGLGEYIPTSEELKLYLTICEKFIKENNPNK